MAHFLRWRRFNNQKEVEASVKEFFTLKDKNLYQSGTKELPERRPTTVQPDDLYLEYLAAFVVSWKIDYQNFGR